MRRSRGSATRRNDSSARRARRSGTRLGRRTARHGSGLPIPRRRTFASAILASAHSDLAALRHPCLRWPATPARGAWAAPSLTPHETGRWRSRSVQCARAIASPHPLRACVDLYVSHLNLRRVRNIPVMSRLLAQPGSGLPTPSRRTLTFALRATGRSETSALHGHRSAEVGLVAVCAGRLRHLEGLGSPEPASIDAGQARGCPYPVSRRC
jgi:hypothetical protein